MTDETKKKWRFDRTWIIDKAIELSIFVLGFLIALWIDDVRDQNDIKQLKRHYMAVVQFDLEQDHEKYSEAYRHDSIRAEACDYILDFLLRRQNADIHSMGLLKFESKARIGPGFDFEGGPQFMQGDTIMVIAEKKGWYLDTSGFWLNKQLVKDVENDFNWFSKSISDTVKNKIEGYTYYVDQTKSVFQKTTGYEGLIAQNTSSFMEATELETALSEYYSLGSYLNWLENYYRDNHYPNYNELRYTYGPTDLFQFLYTINNEENSRLIQQLTLASIHAKKEKVYYLKVLEMNEGIQDLIKNMDL